MSLNGFSEPKYVSPYSASSLLSLSRPATSSSPSLQSGSLQLKSSSTSLHSLNLFLDELLHLFVYSSLSSTSSPSSTIPGGAILALTTDRFKTAGVLKVLQSNPLAKSAVLEAELAIREYVRIAGRGSNSPVRTDAALMKNPSRTQARNGFPAAQGMGGGYLWTWEWCREGRGAWIGRREWEQRATQFDGRRRRGCGSLESESDSGTGEGRIQTAEEGEGGHRCQGWR
ncbi:hypothetical protein BT69DRAFT_1107730 [Atractiella rhizophila]|nr:hypothetical protein BT69DRAFT_1107730 [Atractiella rhizophila]